MDPSLITKIAAAGAMGVSIYCIIKVYDLLKKEQSQPNPRPIFIRTIYVSMGFAILMTLLSLGIEFARIEFDPQINELRKDLDNLTTNGYYSVNNELNPDEITLNFAGKDYVLSKAISEKSFSEKHFTNSELKLESISSDRFNAVKGTDDPIIMGYILNTEIEEKADHLRPNINEEEHSDKDLFVMGITYTPPKVKNKVTYSIGKNNQKARKYLTEFISIENADNESDNQAAIKALAQGGLMKNLSTGQSDTLIKVLNSDVRELPYRYWELAQVHLTRQSKSQDEQFKESETENIIQSYEKYIIAFVDDEMSLNPGDCPIEFGWYNDALDYLKEHSMVLFDKHTKDRIQAEPSSEDSKGEE